MVFLEVYFATSNRHKFEEAKKVLAEFKITVKHFPFTHNEIRSESLEEVAREAVLAAYKQCREPVFVEDSGLFIDSLNGFPGAYSAWALKKIGLPGILRLMNGVDHRGAYFEACIAFKKDAGHVATFTGKCAGSIASEERGTGGFGYDPIFVPEGHNQTFAESITLKNKLSHRYKSLLEFSKTLTSRR